jgi:Metallo-peptidase family M12B Reprolysin-like
MPHDFVHHALPGFGVAVVESILAGDGMSEEDRNYLATVRYISTEQRHSGQPQVDIGFRATKRVMQRIAARGYTFDGRLQGTAKYAYTVFDNSMAPFNTRPQFGFFTAAPVEDMEVDAQGLFDGDSAALLKLANTKQLRHEHQIAGFDMTVYVIEYADTDAQSYRCTGGCALMRHDVHSRPYAVVDAECLLQGRHDVVVHEIGHLFGLDHDLETIEYEVALGKRIEMPPPGSQNCGFRYCASKGRGSVRTQMSYQCAISGPWCSLTDDELPIEYFSCAKITVGGIVIGYEAGEGEYGANNCRVLVDNWDAVASEAELFDSVENIKQRSISSKA